MSRAVLSSVKGRMNGAIWPGQGVSVRKLWPKRWNINEPEHPPVGDGALLLLCEVQGGLLRIGERTVSG